MFVLGTLYIEGNKLEANEGLGENLLTEAAFSGHVPSINYLVDGFLEAGNTDAALEMLTNLSENGVTAADVKLVRLMLDSNSELYNLNKAESYINAFIVDAGSLEEAEGPTVGLANSLYSLKLDAGVDEKTRDVLIANLEVLAEKNFWPAINKIASIYIQGTYGIEKDPIKGFGLLTGAAEAGIKPAMFQLGNAYLNGTGVAINKKRGIDLLEDAVKGDFTPASIVLAKLTLRQEYSGYTENQAIAVLIAAAEAGNNGAAISLSQAYAEGLGIERSGVQALKYSKLAADNGSLAGRNIYASQLLEFGSKEQKSQALEIFQTSASDGNASAAISLLEIYLEDGNDNKDPQFLDQYIDRILATKSPAGLVYLGNLFFAGELIEQDVARGISYIQQAYDANFNGAKIPYAELLISGEYVKQDVDQGFKIISDFADEGSIGAKNRLASLYLEKDMPYSDFERGFEIMKEIALNFANVGAASRVGSIYLSGNGTERDRQKAFQFFEIAAAKGHAPSQYQVGNIYLRGDVKGKSFIAAQSYFEKAAAQGFEPAKLRLGDVYLAQRNNKKAIEIYREVADSGNVDGEIKVAEAYLQPNRFPGKSKDALEILNRLSNEGVAKASILLANLYKNGRTNVGIAQDYAKSLAYFDAAVAAGDMPAEGMRFALIALINDQREDWENLEILFSELSEIGTTFEMLLSKFLVRYKLARHVS
jgi:hypothetical protein